jgi:acyl CoA:acetate/3-ketoacid CoA transferase
VLCEIAPGVDLEKDILNLMPFKPLIAPDLKVMDERIFDEGKMGLGEKF